MFGYLWTPNSRPIDPRLSRTQLSRPRHLHQSQTLIGASTGHHNPQTWIKTTSTHQRYQKEFPRRTLCCKHCKTLFRKRRSKSTEAFGTTNKMFWDERMIYMFLLPSPAVCCRYYLGIVPPKWEGHEFILCVESWFHHNTCGATRLHTLRWVVAQYKGGGSSWFARGQNLPSITHLLVSRIWFGDQVATARMTNKCIYKCKYK